MLLFFFFFSMYIYIQKEAKTILKDISPFKVYPTSLPLNIVLVLLIMVWMSYIFMSCLQIRISNCIVVCHFEAARCFYLFICLFIYL